MAYQLGFGGRSLSEIISGDMNDQSLGGMRNRMRYDDYDYYKDDNRATNRTYQVSTSLKFSAPVDLSLSPISLQWSTRYSVRPDTSYYDTTRSFPEFHLGAQSSALNKLELVSRYAQGVSLSSSFAVKKNTSTSSASGGTSVGTTYEMSPLVSVNGTVKKWPITFSYQHSLSSDKTESNGGATETKHDGDNIDMNYEVQKNGRGLQHHQAVQLADPDTGADLHGHAVFAGPFDDRDGRGNDLGCFKCVPDAPSIVYIYR